MQYDSNHQSLTAHLDTYIRSVSGVRNIFAASAKNRGPAVAPLDLLIVGLFAHAFTALYPRRRLTIALATDSRPTGGALAAAVAQALRLNDCELRYLGIIPTPQFLAYCGRQDTVDGGICITASHNPIGYNGLKFVNATGAVIDAEQFAQLSAHFDALLADEQLLRRHRAAVSAVAATQRVSPDRAAVEQSQRDYAAIVRAALTGGAIGAAADGLALPRAAAAADTGAGVDRSAATSAHHCTIVADYNGGARACSIDGELCREYGARFTAYGTRVGQIVRQIEPEGAALHYLQRQVARLVRRERRLHEGRGRLSTVQRAYIGYMTDNDGDRGNIVYYDPNQRRVRIVAPQELFALLAMIRFSAYRSNEIRNGDERRRHSDGQRAAGLASLPIPLIIANGPTSRRVDDIATRYGGEVRRAEVGEANVIGAAAAYDTDGSRRVVLLSGEGSNGGCIIAPARVRDPLTTVLLILQALRRRSTDGVSELLHQLPQYRTTAVTDAAASLPIISPVPATARLRYLLAILAELCQYGGEQLQRGLGGGGGQPLRRSAGRNARLLPATVAHFTIHHYLGSKEHCCVESTLATYTKAAHERTVARLRGDAVISAALKRGGGLKCSFFDQQNRFIASLWWRGSATERKVRLIADVAPPYTAHYTELMRWHCRLVAEACQ